MLSNETTSISDALERRALGLEGGTPVACVADFVDRLAGYAALRRVSTFADPVEAVEDAGGVAGDDRGVDVLEEGHVRSR